MGQFESKACHGHTDLDARVHPVAGFVIELNLGLCPVSVTHYPWTPDTHAQIHRRESLSGLESNWGTEGTVEGNNTLTMDDHPDLLPIHSFVSRGTYCFQILCPRLTFRILLE